jgi:hypothetical protein
MSFFSFRFSILLFFFMPLAASALDLSDANSTLADVFEWSTDDNEGLTSFRSLNIPVGGRAESLGSACTALCDDISFFDYNPAASSVLPQTEIAVFHNAWIADSAMETISATSRDGNLGYGAQLKCFYVPFSEYNLFGERVAGSYYTETSATINASYNFFAGYDFKGLAVGSNLRFSWRGMPDYTDNQTDEIISGSGLEQSALAVMADVGVLLRFNFLKNFADRDPNLSLGLALNNAGVSVTGFGSALALDDPLPTRLSAALAYRIFAPVLFTAEFRKPLNLMDFSSSGAISIASGMEITVTRFFDFDMGFLVQGGNPRISMGSGFQIKAFQMNVNYTFDLTSSQNPVNHISLSAKIKLGDKGRSKLREQVDAYYINGLRLYAEGDLDGAIVQWDLAIALDKRFDPAIDAKVAAIRFQNAKQKIMDMQKLDISISGKDSK